MSVTRPSLFDRLPALYRLRDARLARGPEHLSPAEAARLGALRRLNPPLTAVQQQELDQLTAKAARGPLQSLLMLVDEQIAVLAENLDQLYDDQFIETCAEWVIPYLGDVIGYRSIHGVAPAVASPRAEVAHTISFRRRKGTVLVLEQLARDVTNWGAHAIEFFSVLADTQYLNHLRPDNHYAPDLRGWRAREYQNTGFDRSAHKVDVRRVAVERGRYNLKNVGIFLWSLNAYGLTDAPATPAPPTVSSGAQCFRFSSLGHDLPLFNRPISQGSELTAPARPMNVPNRLSRRVLARDLKRIRTGSPGVYYGAGKSLAVSVDGARIDAAQLQVCNLSGDEGHWINTPVAGSAYAAIDPELGRLALPPPAAGAPASRVTTSFTYGFNADLGGGEYARSSTFTASPEQVIVQVPGDYLTIQDALNALPGDGVVEITDSEHYLESAGLVVAVGASGHVELRAADLRRPTLVLGGALTVTGGAESAFDLNGVVVSYAPPIGGTPPPALVHAPASGTSQLRHLGLTHCTLVPGWARTPSGDPQPAYRGQPALVAEAAGLNVVVQRSILGGLRIAPEAAADLTDSIVDATDPSEAAYLAGFDASTGRPRPGGALTIQGCTVVGKVYSSLVSLASNCLFLARRTDADRSGVPPAWSAAFWASRKQEGCARFSYLPAGAITLRPFECVEEGPTAPRPIFYSWRYGDPGYLKLVPTTDDHVRRGADDGGEMGAFHFLLAPWRETDVRVRIQEYLPVGLEFGVFYET